MDRDVFSLRVSPADSLSCTASMTSGTGMLVNRAVTSYEMSFWPGEPLNPGFYPQMHCCSSRGVPIGPPVDSGYLPGLGLRYM